MVVVLSHSIILLGGNLDEAKAVEFEADLNQANRKRDSD